MLKIITLSKSLEKNEKTIEATFSYNGELVPLKVNEKDHPLEFIEINKLLEQPNLDFDEVSQELFNLMSPEAKVRESISSSYYLSESLTIRDGHIFFGKFRLEETLANHMLSLLGEENVPKDEKMWRSYVKFLDNLHQNADEDVRKQLFRWMEYENSAGNAFGITDDGCLVGYKGCGGTVLEPMSVFSGNAIVDGVEYNGQIPNKVGSVIQMPRSAVQVDPAVGCSYGLHVGTRDYAVQWAPVLILVKVNPRDVVSVPYECESQKMRVCEYTVLKVTDAKDEHTMYHSYGDESDKEDSYGTLSLSEAYDALGEYITVEVDGDSTIEGEVVDVYEEGVAYIVIHTDEGTYENIELSRITYCNLEDGDEEDEEGEDYAMSVNTALELLSVNSEVYIVRDDDKEYVGSVVDVYVAPGKEPGVIIKDEDDKYSHIKLNRIHFWEENENTEETSESLFPSGEDLFPPGLEEAVSDFINLIVNPQGEDDCDCEDECKYESEDCDLDSDDGYNIGQFKPIYDLKEGTQVVIVKQDIEGVNAVVGKVVAVIKDDMLVILRENDSKLTEINFTDILSLQIVE